MNELWYGFGLLLILSVISLMVQGNSNQQTGGANGAELIPKHKLPNHGTKVRHWKGNLFNNYYYYDPWWAYPSPYNRLCDAYSKRNCADSWEPKDCLRRQYDKCVTERIY